MDNRYSITRSNYIFRGFTDHSAGEKENSFCFQKRGGKIDWKKIAAIDVDNFEHEYSINVLQDNIDNFVFCCIESEIDVKSVNPLFIKLFKIGQLIAEYLLHSQDHLVTIMEKVQQKSPKPGNELLKEKYEYNAENEHVHDRGKKPSNKDPVIGQVTGAVSCTFCYKVFADSRYVIKHIMRRHPEELAAGIKNVSCPNQFDRASDNIVGQKQIIDFMAKEMNELKQSLEKVKSEIEICVDSVVDNLKKQDKNPPSSEANVLQFLDTWKREEEEKHKADLEKMEREFANKLHEINLKVSDSENVIRSLEKKFFLSVQEVKQELHYSTENAVRELLDKYKTGFSEIKHELQTQLTESHEKCLAKLSHQDSQLRNGMAEICLGNSIELQRFKVLLETTLSKMNSIDNVYDLQQELKRYLELCYAKSQRRAQKKQNKSKGQNSHNSRNITQNMVSRSSLAMALKDTAKSTSEDVPGRKVKSGDVKSESKRIKSVKQMEALSCDQTQAVQTHENVKCGPSSHNLPENETNTVPIMVRPVVTESKVSAKKHLNFQGQREMNCSESKVAVGSMKVLNFSENELNNSFMNKHDTAEVKPLANSSAVCSWLQGEVENSVENVGMMHPVVEFELQGSRKTNDDAHSNSVTSGKKVSNPITKRLNCDENVGVAELQGNRKTNDAADSNSVTSGKKVNYHTTKRLKIALQESPNLVHDDFLPKIHYIVNRKMEQICGHKLHVTNADFTDKMDLINFGKQSLAKKLPDYCNIRNWYNNYADQAVELHLRGGGSKRKISFANPEVTVEVNRSSSEEAEELSDDQDQSSGHSKNDGFAVSNQKGDVESSLSETRLCLSLPVIPRSVPRKLPEIPSRLLKISSFSRESSSESFGYPFKLNPGSPYKEEECDELDEESTSGKELSSWDDDDLSSH